MRRRTVQRLPIVVAVCLAAAAPCAAQVEARLDASVAVVKYDGFLSSGAAALSSSVAWRGTSATVAARGTFLLFESGNTSLQGLLSAGTFSPPLGPLRIEGAAEAGGSSYSAYGATARFLHVLGNVRAHLMSNRWGFFAGVLAGVVSNPGSSGQASGVSAGAWGCWWCRSRSLRSPRSPSPRSPSAGCRPERSRKSLTNSRRRSRASARPPRCTRK